MCNRHPKMVALLHIQKGTMAKYQLTTESAGLEGLRIAARRDVAVNWASRANACLLAKICHSALTRKL